MVVGRFGRFGFCSEERGRGVRSVGVCEVVGGGTVELPSLVSDLGLISVLLFLAVAEKSGARRCMDSDIV